MENTVKRLLAGLLVGGIMIAFLACLINIMWGGTVMFFLCLVPLYVMTLPVINFERVMEALAKLFSKKKIGRTW